MGLFDRVFSQENHKNIIIVSIILIIAGAATLVVNAVTYDRLTEASQMKSDVTYSVSATNVERVATEISSAELTGLVIPEYEYEGDYDLYSFTLGQDHLLILSAVSTAQPTKNIRGHAIALDRNSSSLLDSMVSAQERTDGTTYGAYVLWHVPSSFLYTYLAICALIIAGLLLLCLFVAKRSNNQKDVIRLRGMGGGGYNVRR